MVEGVLLLDTVFFGDEDECDSGWWLLRRVKKSIFLIIIEMEFSRAFCISVFSFFSSSSLFVSSLSFSSLPFSIAGECLPQRRAGFLLLLPQPFAYLAVVSLYGKGADVDDVSDVDAGVVDVTGSRLSFRSSPWRAFQSSIFRARSSR